jgi:hypothetical protein
MKYFLTIIISLTLLSTITSRLKTKIENTAAKQYIPFAQLPYCQPNIIKEKSCSVCSQIKEKGFEIKFLKTVTSDEININMVISQSQTETVISFGGPKSTDIVYLQNVYKKGMSKVSTLNNKPLETEFWNVYMEFRNDLIKALKKGGKVALVGHSFGGSLALIAAYDISLNKLAVQTPNVYTFGALKTGDSEFKTTVKNLVPSLYGITYVNDYYSMFPRCVYMNGYVFHCYRNYVNLVSAYPPFAYYYWGYSPIIRQQLVHAIPQIVRNIPELQVIRNPDQKGLVQNVLNGPAGAANTSHSNDPLQGGHIPDTKSGLTAPIAPIAPTAPTDPTATSDPTVQHRNDIENKHHEHRHRNLEHPKEENNEANKINTENVKETKSHDIDSNNTNKENSPQNLEAELNNMSTFDNRQRDKFHSHEPMHYEPHRNHDNNEFSHSTIGANHASHHNRHSALSSNGLDNFNNLSHETPAPSLSHHNRHSDSLSSNGLNNINNQSHETLTSSLSHHNRHSDSLSSNGLNNINNLSRETLTPSLSHHNRHSDSLSSNGLSNMSHDAEMSDHSNRNSGFSSRQASLGASSLQSSLGASSPQSSFGASGSHSQLDRHHASFLQTEFTDIIAHNKKCKGATEYVICEYDPKVHQIYFGINVEECS